MIRQAKLQDIDVIMTMIENGRKHIQTYNIPQWINGYPSKDTIAEDISDIDHIHCLFKAKPNTNLSKFLNSYKSLSSRLIKKEYPTIRKYLWKEYFWSPSYCLITTGGATIEVIKRYIENQGLKD